MDLKKKHIERMLNDKEYRDDINALYEKPYFIYFSYNDEHSKPLFMLCANCLVEHKDSAKELKWTEELARKHGYVDSGGMCKKHYDQVIRDMSSKMG